MKIFKLFIALCQLIAIFACSNSEESRLILPQSTKITYAGVELTDEETGQIERFLGKLKSTREEIYSEADGHLLFYIEGQREPKPYAIFFKDGLIYEGYFQDAWTDRMNGRMSLCYKIDNKTHNLLLSILSRHKK